MALRDIIGHERIINILRGYIRRERLPHALLFAGDEGIGKRFTAINLAKALNCQNNSDALTLNSRTTHQEIDCCDECPSCKKIDKLMHPELLISPKEQEEKEREIKCLFMSHPDVIFITSYKREIRINVIRYLHELLSYRPFEGRWKIAIIDDAHTMNEHSANAFLETLEEPPTYSIIILITPRPDMLLGTIRSRCQRLNFTPISIDGMTSLLRERLNDIDNERLSLLGELSGGRPGYALNEDLLKHRDRMFNIFLEMFGNPAKELWKDKEEMEAWFESCELWLRDMAILKATKNPEFLINKDLGAKIKELSEGLELQDILNLYKEFYNIKRLLVCNLNRPITLYYTNLLLRRVRRV